MKLLTAFIIATVIVPTTVLAHGQAVGSISGTISHYLMDISHLSFFLGGLIFSITVIFGLFINAWRSSPIKISR